MKLMTKHYLEPKIFSWPHMEDVFGHLRPAQDDFYDEKTFAPATDIIETDTEYRLSIDLPGMKKEDIKIEVLDHSLVVSGERVNEAKEVKEKFQRYEKSYGSFKRTFSLPKSVQADNIQAQHHLGVLVITLPKSEPPKAKKIEVTSKE